MNDSEKFKRTKLFLAACAMLHKHKNDACIIPYNNCKFVSSIIAEQAAGNGFALHFTVLNRADGPYAPDFMDGLALCQPAGVQFRRYAWKEEILILLEPREIVKLKASMEFPGAWKLAKRYLELCRV